MKTLLILRGTSGSGKSTLASIIAPAHVICSNDDFMVDEHGNYKFAPALHQQARKKCFLKANSLMEKGEPLVVIANCDTNPDQFHIYEEAAECFGYQVHHVVVENRDNRKNVHKVPSDMVERQRRNLRESIIL